MLVLSTVVIWPLLQVWSNWRKLVFTRSSNHQLVGVRLKITLQVHYFECFSCVFWRLLGSLAAFFLTKQRCLPLSLSCVVSFAVFVASCFFFFPRSWILWDRGCNQDGVSLITQYTLFNFVRLNYVLLIADSCLTCFHM